LRIVETLRVSGKYLSADFNERYKSIQFGHCGLIPEQIAHHSEMISPTFPDEIIVVESSPILSRRAISAGVLRPDDMASTISSFARR
jgi:hypothetical protein